jgi:muramoyltetrapeptide carboxypeptidase
MSEKPITIAITMPACRLTQAEIEKGARMFEKEGIDVIFLKPRSEASEPFNGTEKDRARDFEKIYAKKNVDVVIAGRGGCGTAQITQYLRWYKFKRRPKKIIGYSDITTLLNRVYKETKIPTYHGPMVWDVIKELNYTSFLRLLDLIQNDHLEIDTHSLRKCETLNTGSATGRLVGGNLATICANIGTKDEMLYKRKIILLEDVDEEIYSIDRMMRQLHNCNMLKKAKGLIFGNFRGISNSTHRYRKTLREVLTFYAKKNKLPAIYNFPAGHCSDQQILKIGGKITLTASLFKADVRLLD